MEKEQMVKGFNGWMDEYIKNPKGFLETQGIIKTHLSERTQGKNPTYGELCQATLTHYATLS